jgi:DNA-binding GntR family transcriptional regulator
VARAESPLVGELQPNRSLKAQVFESVRNAIVHGQLEGGRLYSVEALSRDMKVSRTPVREALLDLASRGMVRFERTQGFRVLEMSVEDLQDILTMRMVAEVPAAYRATQLITADGVEELRAQVAKTMKLKRTGKDQPLLEMDRQFHRCILETAGNMRLADHVDQLRDLMTLHGYYSNDVQRDLHRHLSQHGDIVTAMAEGDPEAAGLAMKTHLVETGRDMLRHVGNGEGTLEWADVVAVPSRRR